MQSTAQRVEHQLTEGRVLHRLGVAAPRARVGVGPELAELRRARMQILEEPGQSRVIG